MIDKLQAVVSHYNDLSELMSQPDAMADMNTYTKMAREHRSMNDLVEYSKKYSAMK